MSAVAAFRFDASPGIGAGHAMRCLAFADTLAWAGWRCRFGVNATASATVPALARQGDDIMVVSDAGDADALVADASVVIVDHYGYAASKEQGYRRAQAPLIVFDDLADRPHDCDILVDPSPARRASDYQPHVPATCHVLTGPRYALIARSWRARRRHALESDVARAPQRILVSMGATDPNNVTARVLDAIGATRIDAAVDVVLGAAASHRAAIERRQSASVRLHIEPEDFPRLAAGADLVIGGAGSSSFERAVMGLPTLAVVLADNQRAIAAALGALGAAEIVDAATLADPHTFGACIEKLLADPARRRAIGEAAARLTDGRGCFRLLGALAGAATTSGGLPIRLRPAETEDEQWLLDLQTVPATRRYARNPAVPTASQHSDWFRRMLDSEDSLLLVAESGVEQVAMGRLDRLAGQPAAFEVSIAVAESGRGVGKAVLELMRRLAPGADLIAEIHPDNAASLAVFAAAGYRADGGNRYRKRAA